PIVIPAQGGSFQFEVEIVNNAASPALFNVWIDAVLPSGSVYGPMLQRTLNPGAGFQLTRQLNQSIPGNAPAGEYTYRINAGGYPNFIVEQDSFNFTKSANGDNTPGNYSGWEISEWNTLRNEEYHTAANLTIHKAYPNPFNETTSISFTLNQTAEVYITLYDVQGRRAGQIVRTYYSAGYNSVEISAEGLASGIYILRLESQGRDYYQKLILLK
ncbi:MAG: T9SS type A sorting domain-containing protein, partial [FCB group bacterium]|nr:T9SS type A sorting domain-containing protein [FCB group bacterium]